MPGTNGDTRQTKISRHDHRGYGEGSMDDKGGFETRDFTSEGFPEYGGESDEAAWYRYRGRIRRIKRTPGVHVVESRTLVLEASPKLRSGEDMDLRTGTNQASGNQELTLHMALRGNANQNDLSSHVGKSTAWKCPLPVAW